MANLTPVNSFDDVIQLETNTIAIGGAGGIMNAQAQALLNRTAYLKGVYDALTAMIGATGANGIAPLVNGKVPSANLPSYVDDVLEFEDLASFPNTGEDGKLYIALDTNLVYRWTGSTYAATSGSLALGETTSTAYRGDRGKTAYDHSQVTTGNPHGTAISDITGLQTALDAKATVTQAKAEYLTIACSDESTALTAGTGKITFRMPYAMTLTSVRASLSTAQTSGNIFTVDINESGTSILSTKLTIDNSEKTSTTAAAAPVISDSSLADDAEITIDIDQIGDGTAKGLKVTLIGTRV